MGSPPFLSHRVQSVLKSTAVGRTAPLKHGCGCGQKVGSSVVFRGVCGPSLLTLVTPTVPVLGLEDM